MCGRDAEIYRWRQVHEFRGALAVSTPEQDPEPNYNRAPIQPGWVLVANPVALMQCGHEKLRYLDGDAEAIRNDGERVSVSINDI